MKAKAFALSAMLLLAAVCSAPGPARAQDEDVPPPDQREYVDIPFNYIDGQLFFNNVDPLVDQISSIKGVMPGGHVRLGLRWKTGQQGRVLQASGTEYMVSALQQVVTALDRPATVEPVRLQVTCQVVATTRPELLLAARQSDFEVELDDGNIVTVPSAMVRPRGFAAAAASFLNPLPAINIQPPREALYEAVNNALVFNGSDVVVSGSATSGTVTVRRDTQQYQLPFYILAWVGDHNQVTVLARLPYLHTTMQPGTGLSVDVAYQPIQYTAPANQVVAVGMMRHRLTSEPTYVFLIAVQPLPSAH